MCIITLFQTNRRNIQTDGLGHSCQDYHVEWGYTHDLNDTFLKTQGNAWDESVDID